MWFIEVLFSIVAIYFIFLGIKAIRNKSIYLSFHSGAINGTLKGQKAIFWGWIFIIFGVIVISVMGFLVVVTSNGSCGQYAVLDCFKK